MASVRSRSSYILPLAQGVRVCLSDEGRRLRRRSDPSRIGTVVNTARNGRYLYVLWEALNAPADLAGSPAGLERIREEHLRPVTAPISGASETRVKKAARRRSSI